MKKNILFIMSDQHNHRCLSGKGHPDVKTPALDSLMARGISFDNAYCNNPICTPSRMSNLSGQYPSTHRYYGLYGIEPTDRITNMFSWFKKNGYRTGALGKLHTPRYWIERDCQFVYDEFIEYPKYLEALELYEKNDNRRFCGYRDGECSNIPYEHSCESVLVKQFKRFLHNQGEPNDRGSIDVPWFAWVSFARPHEPYTPSREFYDLYDEEQLFLPPVAASEKPLVKGLREKLPQAELRKQLHAYLSLVSQVDASIGEIVSQLERDKLLENTIIVYTADHGDYAGEHGLMEKVNGISYGAITRVPLIVYDASIDRVGETRKQMIESVDLFPTICDLAEMETPNTVQGESFIKLLSDSGQSTKEYALTENVNRKAIASRDWRYVANIDGDDELYDLREDPWELTNRIHDPACMEIIAHLSRVLMDRVIKANWPVTVFDGFWNDHRYNEDNKADIFKTKERTLYW